VAKLIPALFLALHGLVHLLYFGQSATFFQLQPGLNWPAGSWVFSSLLGDTATRRLAGAACVVGALGFLIAATGLLLSQSWWRTAAISSATFSVLLYLIFWNGGLQRLPDQGLVGILIDAAILLALLVFRWPRLAS